MTRIERAIRRALNPLSTRATMLIQGHGARRALARVGGLDRPSPTSVTSGFVPVRRGLRRVTARAAGRRPPGLVQVPDLIGLRWPTAHTWVLRCGLVAANPDPDGPPLATVASPDSVVVDQAPDPRAAVSPGTRVTLWLDRGPGSAGVREPRCPKPGPRAVRGAIDEDDGEAIG